MTGDTSLSCQGKMCKHLKLTSRLARMALCVNAKTEIKPPMRWEEAARRLRASYRASGEETRWLVCCDPV